MANVRGNRFLDSAVTAGGACVLVAGLAAMDGRVRDGMTSLLASDPTSYVSSAGLRSTQLARTVFGAVSAPGDGYTPLAMFAVVGVVFLLLMLKS